MTKVQTWLKLPAMDSILMLNEARREADPVPISLSKAAVDIGINRQYLKGYAEALGIRLVEVGPSLTMSPRDFERLRQHLAAERR